MTALRNEQILNQIPALKLNIQMLSDGFAKRDVETILYSRGADRQKLDQAMLYFGQENLEDHIIYVCQAETLSGHPIENPDICFALIGNQAACFYSIQNPILLFPHAEPAYVLNTLLEIFSEYRRFEDDLHYAVLAGGLNSLCQTALKFFENPIQVHDEKFNMLCRPQTVSGMTELDQNKATGIYSYQMDLINHLKKDKRYVKTLSTHGAHLWVNHPLTPFRCLYVNLFDSNGQYRGRIILNEINSFFYPGQFQMLEYFSEYVLLAITKPDYITEKNYTSLELLLQNYLHGSIPSRETALYLLGMKNWQTNDAYICAKIRIPEKDRRINCLDVTITSLSLIFEEACTFVDEDYIYQIGNLTRCHLSSGEFEDKLRKFAWQGGYIIGVSSCFHDFFRLPYAYEQAGISIAYGLSKTDKDCLFIFDEAIHEYLMHIILEKESIGTICHEKIFELQRLDAEKGTDYYLTFRTYLENERNMSSTSQIMHLHRSTLQYRLDKILEILDFPLEDPKFRYYLLTCFYLLDHRK